MIEPIVEVTCYEVSCLPMDHPERRLFVVWVEYRSGGLWAVVRSRFDCFDRQGNRTSTRQEDGETRDEWIARTRFDLDTALTIARKVAPELRVNGYTAADILARGGDE